MTWRALRTRLRRWWRMQRGVEASSPVPVVVDPPWLPEIRYNPPPRAAEEEPMGKGRGKIRTPTPKRRRLYVSHSKRDKTWRVTEGGKPVRPTTSWSTKAAAVAWATLYCRNEATRGQWLSLYIKGKDGRVQEERTYPRSSDPHPPKG